MSNIASSQEIIYFAHRQVSRMENDKIIDRVRTENGPELSVLTC